MDTLHLRQLHVSNLNTNTTEDHLKKYFEQWGKIKDVMVVKDLLTQLSKGFGFITYAAEDMVDNVQGARPHRIQGKTVTLKRVIPKAVTKHLFCFYIILNFKFGIYFYLFYDRT